MSHARIAQIGGPIGPFLDTVQQRQVPVTVIATCKYVSMASPASTGQYEAQVQAAMLKAIGETVADRMATGQISFKDLGTDNTAGIVPEILARSGLAQAGLAIDKLVMRFGIDGRPPAALPGAQLGPAASSGGVVIAAPQAGKPASDASADILSKGKAGPLVLLGVVLLLIAGAVAVFVTKFQHKEPSAAAAPPPAAAAKAGHGGGKK
jgi:hypothetical protein